MSGVDLRKRLGLNSNFVRFKFIGEEINKFPMKKGLIVFGQGSGHVQSRGNSQERQYHFCVHAISSWITWIPIFWQRFKCSRKCWSFGSSKYLNF